MLEIERKFLVKSDAYRMEAFDKKEIIQGFLNTHPDRTVRVRLSGNKGFITVKGRTDAEGITRFEWEREIPAVEVRALLEICEPGVIRKVRYLVRSGEHLVEVDEFAGENEGLVVAEIEMNEINEFILKPDWLGDEVTGEPKYYNSQLSKKPYTTWKNV
ncbi:CYTH domain-containing protein [Muriicola jejuensis]|uniref:CYTH domain-containing protein n=1 Tax=Muriicola jejuensis TaxID=504488 RepID=A0A6P0UDX9_9FLAO|nr:CYTH domain-containing protein [Muriicola jejuensis]NER10119.1 CYTH domain-containing protein [Muriicola jejuensis]SMP02828.1 CYTH domain-containing protein [Muriicola jejuensis]